MNAKERIIEKYISIVMDNATTDVSITDISSRASINRTTFYRHFSKIGDLENEAIRSFVRKYYKPISETIEKQFLNAKKYRDLDSFSDSFIELIESLRSFLNPKNIKLIKPGWIYIAFDELKKTIRESFHGDIGVFNEWFIENVALSMIFWAMRFMKHGELYSPSLDESLLDSYALSIAPIDDFMEDPYGSVNPDMLDIMMSLVYSNLSGKGSPKTVSALCSSTGISRQAFYRRFSSLEECKKITEKETIIAIQNLLCRFAFTDELKGNSFKLIHPFKTIDNFEFLNANQQVIFTATEALFNVLERSVRLLEKEGNEDRKIYYHIFFYIVASFNLGVQIFKTDGQEQSKRHLERLKFYRNGFPELDSIIIHLSKIINHDQDPAEMQRRPDREKN